MRKKMTRRRFCKIAATGLAATAFPVKLSGNENSGKLARSPVVWELEGNPGSLFAELFSAFYQQAGDRVPALKSATVLIKPNLCLPYPSKLGPTTSAETLTALCRYLHRAGVKRIIVADHTLKGTTEQFTRCDILEGVGQVPSAKWMLLNDRRYYEPVDVPGKILKATEVFKLMRRADLVINLATAKHHSATHVSLCVKNLMGFIWDRETLHTQLDLQQAIGDLTTAIVPHLNIVDASRVLLTGGPTGPGQLIQENKLFASRDVVAVDAVVLSRYTFGMRQISARELPHLLTAHQNGSGEIDIQKIKIQSLT